MKKYLLAAIAALLTGSLSAQAAEDTGKVSHDDAMEKYGGTVGFCRNCGSDGRVGQGRG